MLNYQKYWWQLTFCAPTNIEEIIYWKLSDLRIDRIALTSDLSNLKVHKYSLWVPEIETTQFDRKNIVDQLTALIEINKFTLYSFKWKRIVDEDWSVCWKSHWEPDPVGLSLLILPNWLDLPKKYSDRLVIKIDPGLAFGTGSHPTTRLCLEALDKKSPRNLYVADIGCGSGILSIAALHLGAKKVFAVDTDSLAIKSTLSNIKLNDFDQNNILVSCGSLDVLEQDLNEESLDLVLCNILAPVVRDLAPDLNKFVKVGGTAILSGILTYQVEDIVDIYSRFGWDLGTIKYMNNWSLIELKKNS